MNHLNNLIQELLVLTSLNNLYDENIFSAYQINMWCKELRREINNFIIPNINAIIKFDTKDCPALKMNMDHKKYIDIERLCNKFSQVNNISYKEIYIYLGNMVTKLLRFNYGYYNYFDNILAPRYNQHLLKLAIVLHEIKTFINSIFYFDSEFNDSFCYQPEATLDDITADVLHERSSDLESERVIDNQINNNNDLNFGQNRIKRSSSMHTKLPSKYALNKEAIKQEPINDFQI